MNIKQKQQQLAAWFNGLSEAQKQDLQTEYKAWKNNTRGKDLDLSVDGVRGSSTSFLERKSEQNIQISDVELAKYLQEKTGVKMHCQSCIKENADKKPQFIKAVLENNNPAYAAKLKEILPDEGMSCAVDSMKKSKVAGFAALQVTTQGKVDGVGQITATHGNAGVGVSFRQGVDRPFLTRASIKDGEMEYGVLPVSVGRVDAITRGANTCPCAGNAEDGKLPTNINLPRNIKETGIAGVSHSTENIRIAAGVVTQSDMHKSGSPVALVETEHKISSKTKLLSSASVSPTQLHVNAGTQTKVTPKLDVKTNAFYETGRVNQVGASTTAIYSPNDKWTLAASVGVVHDKDTGKTHPELGATIGRKLGQNGFVEGFVATDIPQNKKEDFTVGVRAGFKF